MTGEILLVAGAIKGDATVPMHPFQVASAAGLSLRAARGLRVAAVLEGSTIRFDQSYPDWRQAVGALACGAALRLWQLEDLPEARVELASALRTMITNDGTVDAPVTWRH